MLPGLDAPQTCWLPTWFSRAGIHHDHEQHSEIVGLGDMSERLDIEEVLFTESPRDMFLLAGSTRPHQFIQHYITYGLSGSLIARHMPRIAFGCQSSYCLDAGKCPAMFNVDFRGLREYASRPHL